MKKLFIALLVALLSLSLALPALANKNGNNGKSESAKKSPVVVYQPRAINLWGGITAISGTVLPVDITLQLTKISPKSLKNYPGVFPTTTSAVVVHVTKDTKIVRKYMGRADFSELAVGDKLSVTGKLQTDGSVNATMVKDESINITFNAAKGAVTAVDTAANTFTIKNNDKEYRVFVTSATKFYKAGVTNPTLADMKVGDEVVVRGVVRQAVNEVTADSVTIKIGEKERLMKQLEVKKASWEKKVELIKSNLAKAQAELEAILKKITEANSTATQ